MVLKINPEYSLEGLMLKLKLQYFGHLMGRVNSFEKTLMLGKIRVGGEGVTEDEMVGWHHRLNGMSLSTQPRPGPAEAEQMAGFGIVPGDRGPA